ncbi:Rieske [2Fe-2S] domain protein [compost metagenome]
MQEYILGREQDFHKLPAEIEIGRLSYLLLSDQGTYRLVSRSCTHAGQMVEVEKDELVCPMHGWSFDLHTGACLNVPSKGLISYTVYEKNGELITQLQPFSSR